MNKYDKLNKETKVGDNVMNVDDSEILKRVAEDRAANLAALPKEERECLERFGDALEKGLRKKDKTPRGMREDSPHPYRGGAQITNADEQLPEPAAAGTPSFDCFTSIYPFRDMPALTINITHF
jgi:hypothetical protein